MGYLEKLDPSGFGVVPKVVESVEYGVASYGFGFLQSRYRASVLGVPVELLAGVAGKALVLGGEMMGLPSTKIGSREELTPLGKAMAVVLPHVDVFANAGIGAYFHTLGVGHGAKAAAALPAGKAPTKALGTTVLGAIPKAPHGDFLSAAELAEMAR